MSDLLGLHTTQVTYLGCILEKTMSGESMANKVISKANERLKFLHQKNNYLTPNLCCLLCNALIQFFKLKTRIQTLQNKFISVYS